jgi:hypothetical protein
MEPFGPGLTEHADRLRWNARYSGDFAPSFAPPQLAVQALDMPLPDGPVLDLAAGPSGTALAAAAAGRPVTAVDVSDVALGLLGSEAHRRGLGELVTLVQADLCAWRPSHAGYALVLCTGYWDRGVFAVAAAAVRPGGLIGWEAFTLAARAERAGLPVEWCLRAGEPATLLPPGFDVIVQQDLGPAPGSRRRMLARRQAQPEARSAEAMAEPSALATGGGKALPTCR